MPAVVSGKVTVHTWDKCNYFVSKKRRVQHKVRTKAPTSQHNQEELPYYMINIDKLFRKYLCDIWSQKTQNIVLTGYLVYPT